MSDLRRTVIYRALHRPNLFLGGERELVLLTAVVCAGLPVSSLNLVAAAIGLGLWIFLIAILRMMGKADPVHEQDLPPAAQLRRLLSRPLAGLPDRLRNDDHA